MNSVIEINFQNYFHIFLYHFATVLHLLNQDMFPFSQKLALNKLKLNKSNLERGEI